jgi:exodeoxyribonuclease VII large subunit
LAAVQDRLRLLGPESVLSRGYSITLDAESGRVIRDPARVRKGARLRTRVEKGELFSRAEGNATAP